MNYHGIEIDYSRDDLFTFQARKLLEKHYMLETEASPQEAFARAALAYTDDLGLAQRIYDYASKGWFMFASPVLSNAPEVGQKAKALPISCFVAGTQVTCFNPETDSYFLKPIEQIVVGDLVRTHMGRARKVLATKESVRDNVREVETSSGIKLTLTGDHRLWAMGSATYLYWVPVDDLGHRDGHGWHLVQDECLHPFQSPTHVSYIWSHAHQARLMPPLDGSNWIRIRSVTPVEGEFTVYDIQVEEDESFVANGIVAHNCYLTYTPDSLSGLIDHSSEIRWLSVKGGGVGGHWSDVRSLSDKSPGPVPFLKTVDADMTAYRQGKTRKGSYAAYLDVSHPDIVEFINIRNPTGGDPNRKCLNLHNAVNITDAFMQACIEGTPWDLIDPSDKTVRDTVDARHLFESILEMRARTGEPYLHFIDTSNRHLPEIMRQKGLKIRGSNLCSEIFLPTSEDRTAVCCLSSVNLSKFDDWSSTPMIRDLITYLDAVLQKFIDWAPDEISRARYSAMQERSLGLGAMGFHDYLQRNRLPWESAMAVGANHRMFSFMQREAIEATLALGRIHGEAPDLVSELTFNLAIGDATYKASSSDFILVERDGQTVGMRAFDVQVGDKILGNPILSIDGLHSHSGRRNAHLLAIAPNANSALIANTSQGPDPRKSNAYASKTRVGTDLTLNPALEELLLERVPDQTTRDALWSDIVKDNGSVKNVDCLTDWEKKVFATAFEIDQRWVVQHAGDRQAYICQGQSVNLFFPAESDRQDVLLTHVKAWKEGLKALYYYRTSTAVTAEKVSVQVERQALTDYVKTEDECLACHG